MRVRLRVLLVAMALVFTGLVAPTLTASSAAANTGGYPETDAVACGSSMWCKGGLWYSGRGYAYRNCTDYVAWKLQSLGVPDSKTRSLGNGGEWAAKAAQKGLMVNTTPAYGAVAVSTQGTWGHVAFVEDVHGNGTITVSEYNYSYNGSYHTRTGTPASMGFTQFVHFGLNGPPTAAEATIDSAIASSRNADGRIEVLGVGPDYKIYGKSQSAPNSGFNPDWYMVNANAKDVTTVSNADGRIEILYVGSDGGVYGRSQTVVNGGFGPQYSLGGAVTKISAATNQDGRVTIFAIGPDKKIYAKDQTIPNGGFSSVWYLLDANAQDITAVSNADGRIEILYVGSDGGVYGRSQTVVNGGFGSEYSIGGNVTRITSARNQDGRITMFAIGPDKKIYAKDQTVPNGGFTSTWYVIQAGVRDVTATSNADGRIEVLGVGTDGAIYGWSQTVPNGGFGVQYTIGGNFL